MKHPNLFFSEKDIQSYRERIKTNPEAKARYDRQIEKAEEYLAEELTSQSACDAPGGNFGMINGQVNKFADCLGVKYIVEGDVRCFEKLKQTVAHYISYERWYAMEYFNRKPLPWHSDLFSTAAVLSMGRVYDLICDKLTAEERKTFAEGIFEKGILPALQDWVLHSMRLHAVDSMGHNWWAVCICEPATALLSVMDELPKETVRPLFEQIDSAIVEFLAFEGNQLFNKIRNYDEQGLFYESLSYGDYATGTLLRYLACYERCIGRNEKIRNALPENLASAVTSFLYPYTDEKGKENYLALDLGDCAKDSRMSGFTKGAVRLGIDTPAVRKCLSLHEPEVWDEIGGLMTDELVGDWNSTPKNMFFPSGFAVMRDSWEPDSTILAIKSGYGWNHSHNDAGHFMIWHRGKELIIDSHNCTYSNEIYRDYYCQDQSHNVLRIGGKGRIHDCVHFATKFPGTIPEHLEGDGFVYVRADCGGPMAHLCTRMFRNYVWIENRILVQFDDVFCIEENDVQYLLHYLGECTAENENSYLIDNGRSHARLISHSPNGMIATEETGYDPYDVEKTIPYLSLSTPEKTLRHLLVHTLELDPELHSTKTEYLESDFAKGIRITEGEKEYEMWFNITADGRYMHDNSINSIAGFETDAYMLIITREKDGKEKVNMINGSFLRRDGKVLFGSFTKKTICVDL